MFVLYLACLIFGGSLLVFTIVTGGQDSADSPESDIDIDTDVNADMDIDVDFDAEADSHSTAHKHNGFELAGFFSFRNIVFFIAFFGLTGTILSLVDTGYITTIISASGIGIFSWVAGYKSMKYFMENQSGEITNINSLSGRPAKVTLDVSKIQAGKVSINNRGATMELKAIVAEISEVDDFAKGEKVLIIEIQDNTAIVINTQI